MQMQNENAQVSLTLHPKEWKRESGQKEEREKACQDLQLLA